MGAIGVTAPRNPFETSPFWQKHDDLLRSCVTKGLSSGQTARRISIETTTPVSRSAVIGRAHRLNLTWGRAAPPTTTPDPFPGPQRCVFPHGDPRAPDFHFCGDEVVEFVHPYCATHHLRCYQRQIPRGQDK